MRVAIYGAGSLGTILGAFISKAGVPIELINRNKAHVEALQTILRLKLKKVFHKRKRPS